MVAYSEKVELKTTSRTIIMSTDWAINDTNETMQSATRKIYRVAAISKNPKTFMKRSSFLWCFQFPTLVCHNDDFQHTPLLICLLGGCDALTHGRFRIWWTYHHTNTHPQLLIRWTHTCDHQQQLTAALSIEFYIVDDDDNCCCCCICYYLYIIIVDMSSSSSSLLPSCKCIPIQTACGVCVCVWCGAK